jgi:hypothetical protein
VFLFAALPRQIGGKKFFSDSPQVPDNGAFISKAIGANNPRLPAIKKPKQQKRKSIMKLNSFVQSVLKRNLAGLLLAVVPIAISACATAPGPNAARNAATATRYAATAAEAYSDAVAAQNQPTDQDSDPAPTSTTDAVLQGITQGLQQASDILSQPR